VAGTRLAALKIKTNYFFDFCLKKEKQTKTQNRPLSTFNYDIQL